MILSDDVERQMENSWTSKKFCQLTLFLCSELCQTCTLEMITNGEICCLFENNTVRFLGPTSHGMDGIVFGISFGGHLDVSRPDVPRDTVRARAISEQECNALVDILVGPLGPHDYDRK